VLLLESSSHLLQSLAAASLAHERATRRTVTGRDGDAYADEATRPERLFKAVETGLSSSAVQLNVMRAIAFSPGLPPSELLVPMAQFSGSNLKSEDPNEQEATALACHFVSRGVELGQCKDPSDEHTLLQELLWMAEQLNPPCSVHQQHTRRYALTCIATICKRSPLRAAAGLGQRGAAYLLNLALGLDTCNMEPADQGGATETYAIGLLAIFCLVSCLGGFTAQFGGSADEEHAKEWLAVISGPGGIRSLLPCLSSQVADLQSLALTAVRVSFSGVLGDYAHSGPRQIPGTPRSSSNLICSSGSLQQLAWLLHSKNPRVARQALAVWTAIAEANREDWAIPIVEQGCIPLCLVSKGWSDSYCDPFLNDISKKDRSSALARVASTPGGNIKLRANVSVGMLALGLLPPVRKPYPPSSIIMESFVDEGGLSGVIELLRYADGRSAAAGFLNAAMSWISPEAPPSDCFAEGAEEAVVDYVEPLEDCTMLVLPGSDEVPGIKMACPPAQVIARASPRMGAAIASTPPGQLPLLRGSYRLWEVIMSHVVAPITFREDLDMSTGMLIELLGVAMSNGFDGLADGYAVTLSRRMNHGVEESAQVLEMGLGTGHSWLTSAGARWLVTAIGHRGHAIPPEPRKTAKLSSLLNDALERLIRRTLS
jgi:hypothetical protein